jgi:putative molybdopterin biosynthesis protein
VPLTWERFDRVLRQRSYFLPPLSGSAPRRSARAAAELAGSYSSEAGEVRLVN